MCAINSFALVPLAGAARRPKREGEELKRENLLSMRGAENGFATPARRRNIVRFGELWRRDFSPAPRQLYRVKNRFTCGVQYKTAMRLRDQQGRLFFPWRNRDPATCNTPVASSRASSNNDGAPGTPILVASSRATCNTSVARCARRKWLRENWQGDTK
jgi:hypothetical protein